MITTKPFQPPIDNAALEQRGPTFAPVPPPAPGCPRCAFPFRRIYAGELICPSCGKRETVARELWEAVQAACVRGLSGVRG